MFANFSMMQLLKLWLYHENKINMQSENWSNTGTNEWNFISNIKFVKFAHSDKALQVYNSELVVFHLCNTRPVTLDCSPLDTVTAQILIGDYQFWFNHKLHSFTTMQHEAIFIRIKLVCTMNEKSKARVNRAPAKQCDKISNLFLIQLSWNCCESSNPTSTLRCHCPDIIPCAVHPPCPTMLHSMGISACHDVVAW